MVGNYEYDFGYKWVILEFKNYIVYSNDINGIF